MEVSADDAPRRGGDKQLAPPDSPSPSTPPRASDPPPATLLEAITARDAALADASAARAALAALEAAVLEPTFKPPSAWAEREVAHRADRAVWTAEAAVASARIADLEATVASLRGGGAVAAALARAEAAEAAAAAARAQAEQAQRALHELRLAVTAGDAAPVRAAVLARGGGSLTLDGVALAPGAVATRVADLDGRGVGVGERASPRAAAGARAASARLMGARSSGGAPAADANDDIRTGAAAVAALAGEFERQGGDGSPTSGGGRAAPAASVPPTPSPAKPVSRVPDDLTPCKLTFGGDDDVPEAAAPPPPAASPPPPPPASPPASPSAAAATIAALEARLAMDEAQLHRLAAALEAADADRAALESALAAAGVPRPPPAAGDTAGAALAARAATQGKRRRRRPGHKGGGGAAAASSSSDSDGDDDSLVAALRADLAAATARADALAGRLAAAAAAVAAGRVPDPSELGVGVEIEPAADAAPAAAPLPVSRPPPSSSPTSSFLPPPLTDDELEAVRLRGERDALMDALVAAKLALAEKQDECVRARRALARAAALRDSSAVALDDVKATLVKAAGGAGVAPEVAAALARAGGVLARTDAAL